MNLKNKIEIGHLGVFSVEMQLVAMIIHVFTVPRPHPSVTLLQLSTREMTASGSSGEREREREAMLRL